jgi:hypothetical protein
MGGRPVTGPDRDGGRPGARSGIEPGESRLRAALRGLVAGRPAQSPPPLKAEPTNAFELAVAERLKTMQRDIDQIRNRLNWLFTLIAGAAVTNVVIALLR